jgi:transposase InsO family protein
VLFFIEHGSRLVRIAGATANPVCGWVTQQARNLCYDLTERTTPATFLIRDRHTKFTPSFGAVFASDGIRIIKTPIRAPRAKAVSERFVGTIRRECLDRLLILGRRHLEAVLAEYGDHYNRHRPHRSLEQRCPSEVTEATAPITDPDPAGMRRTDVLGGLIHEYRLVA